MKHFGIPRLNRIRAWLSELSLKLPYSIGMAEHWKVCKKNHVVTIEARPQLETAPIFPVWPLDFHSGKLRPRYFQAIGSADFSLAPLFPRCERRLKWKVNRLIMKTLLTSKNATFDPQIFRYGYKTKAIVFVIRIFHF